MSGINVLLGVLEFREFIFSFIPMPISVFYRGIFLGFSPNTSIFVFTTTIFN